MIFTDDDQAVFSKCQFFCGMFFCPLEYIQTPFPSIIWSCLFLANTGTHTPLFGHTVLVFICLFFLFPFDLPFVSFFPILCIFWILISEECQREFSVRSLSRGVRRKLSELNAKLKKAHVQICVVSKFFIKKKKSLFEKASPSPPRPVNWHSTLRPEFRFQHVQLKKYQKYR